MIKSFSFYQRGGSVHPSLMLVFTEQPIRYIMACFHPITAYRSHKDLTVNGKPKIYFDFSEAVANGFDTITLPCGRCSGCRLERSRQWAVRCVHEADCWPVNCFLTLTYNDDHVHSNGSLVKRDFQLFMKRLRKKCSGQGSYFNGEKICYPIRFFHCGEYGENLFRPHHHACIFNYDFPDKILWKVKNGNRLYRSPLLEKLWPDGYCLIGDVTWESAAYVARYIMKKVNGDMARFYYKNLDLESGELVDIEPEYITMSRRPGIGKIWYDRFCSDVYPKDFLTINGKKFRPPKYYDKCYELDDPENLEEIKKKRLEFSQANADNNTKERLKVREKVLNAKISRLVREFDNEKTSVQCV